MFENIYVSRNNNTKTESFMNTINITNIIQKDILYDYNLNFGDNIDNIDTINIKYVEFEGEWLESKNNSDKSNILGGIGNLLTEKKLTIPINEGKKEFFMYYNCFLLDFDDKIIFDCKDMPIFEMKIGINYFENYILNKEYANGMYIEYHNTPHYYLSNLNSSGFIILGKKINNQFKLSALKIPSNKALYIPPYILHNDCCLIGEYKVMYNLAEDFSTVRLVNRDNIEEFTKIIFE
jgi:hypothetical protein